MAAWQRGVTSGSYNNCGDCKANNTAETRQMWRCPYEPDSPAAKQPFVRAPRPEGSTVEPTVCPGYTTSLPETIEVARAWGWAERGCLRDFTRDEPTEALVDAVELFGGHVEAFKNKLMTARSKGGLRDE